MRRQKKRQYRSKKTAGKTVLKRFILVFGLVGIAVLIAKPILTPLISQAGVLGEKIYLAKVSEQEKSAYEKQQEDKKNEQEYQKHQAEKQYEKDHENPKVICVGYDNKKFKTTKKECERLSEMAGKEVELEVIVTKRPTPSLDSSNTDESVGATEVSQEETANENPVQNASPEQTTATNASQQPAETRTVPLPETPIEVKTKESGETIDINTKDIQIELEQEDGHITVNAKQDDGTIIELEDDALFHIEERLAIDRIKLSTTTANEFLIQRNSTAAVTNLPLSWDLTTNMLTVTTPAGRKNVPVLPDVAVQNLVGANELDHAIIPESLRKERNVHLGTILDIATLTHQNGEPVYEITGITGQKLFGLFPVAIEKTVEVSGETGKVVGTSKTPLNSLIDLISF